MLKTIVACALFATTFAVHGAGLLPAPPVLTPPATPLAPEVCKPPALRYIHAGKFGDDWWVYWWCPDGSWQWGILSPSTFTQAVIEQSAAHDYGLPVAAPLPKLPANDVIAQLRILVELRAEADKDRPVPVVAKNGNTATRPAYPVINGVPGTKEAARAKVGEACDCRAIKIMRGTVMYCAAPPPNATLVTVCLAP